MDDQQAPNPARSAAEREVPDETKLATVAVELMIKEGRMRPMAVDTVIRDEADASVVGRLLVGCDGEPGHRSGTVSVSSELDHLTRGELYMLAGAALGLCKQALTRAETDTTEGE